MNVSSEEQISALTDNELPVDQLTSVLAGLKHNRDMADRLGRYGVIRDALHRNLPPTLDTALAHRVSAAIAQEPCHALPQGSQGSQQATPQRSAAKADHRRWTGPVAGLAITASVAMLAVFIWPGQQGGSESGSQLPLAQVSNQISGQSTVAGGQSGINGLQTVGGETIRWDRLDPDVQSRLNGYAITHGDQSAGRQVGIVPRHVRSTGRVSEQ